MAIQDALPDRLGPYRLLDRIGEGGMGVVYLAADSEQRLVAVKVLRPQVAGDPTARRRLAREVETMRRVRSPFVAEVIDADVTGRVPYIVTRYVRGRTLEQVVEDYGPRSGLPLQRLACGLAGALAAVHAAGVVHRDLKPGNVMMVGADPVVIDFGIAQAGDTSRLTETGIFVGTPGYLAPEVIEGKPSDQGADVHSWGATVAFAATGRPPYGTGTFEVVFFRILHGGANLDGVPAVMYPLIAAALAREPAQRPSAAWLAAQVAALDLTTPGPAWQTGRSAGGAAQAPQAPQVAAAQLRAPGPRAGPGAGLAAAPAASRRARAGGSIPADQATGYQAPAYGAPAYGAPAYRAPAYEAPGDVADLLPPVRYAPPPDISRGRPQAGQEWAGQDWAGNAARPGRAATAPRRHRMLALAVLVTAVCSSVILPIAGTAAVLAVIAVFRAGDRAQRGLAGRRSARGPRPTDAFVVALSAPWALARSILLTLLVAPFLLCIAAVVALVAIIVTGGSQLLLVGAYAAGAFAALNCLGPGSRGPRRQLNRAFNVIAANRFGAAAATIVLGALAAAFVSLAMIKAPVYWPAPDPQSVLGHLPGAGLFHGAILRLRHAGMARGVRVP